MVAPGEVIRASDVAVQACRVTNSSVQSIADSGSSTILNFNLEEFDTDGMHSTSVNNSRITINTAGIYVFGAAVRLNQQSTYTRAGIRIRLNGTVDIAEEQQTHSQNSILPIHIGCSALWQFGATDYIEVGVFQFSGGARDTNLVTNNSPIFWAARIGS